MTGQVTQRMTRHEVIVAEPGGGWIRPEGLRQGETDGGREWKNWEGEEGAGVGGNSVEERIRKEESVCCKRMFVQLCWTDRRKIT